MSIYTWHIKQQTPSRHHHHHLLTISISFLYLATPQPPTYSPSTTTTPLLFLPSLAGKLVKLLPVDGALAYLFVVWTVVMDGDAPRSLEGGRGCVGRDLLIRREDGGAARIVCVLSLCVSRNQKKLEYGRTTARSIANPSTLRFLE